MVNRRLHPMVRLSNRSCTGTYVYIYICAHTYIYIASDHQITPPFLHTVLPISAFPVPLAADRWRTSPLERCAARGCCQDPDGPDARRVTRGVGGLCLVHHGWGGWGKVLKTWEDLRKMLGKSEGNPGKILEKFWENLGKILGKS